MKHMIVFSIILILGGCIPEENCTSTGEVDHYTYDNEDKNEYYTIATPVYKMKCE